MMIVPGVSPTSAPAIIAPTPTTMSATSCPWWRGIGAMLAFVDASTFALFTRNPTDAACSVGPFTEFRAGCWAPDAAGSIARAQKLIAKKRISFSIEGGKKIPQEDAQLRNPLPAQFGAICGNKRARRHGATATSRRTNGSSCRAGRDGAPGCRSFLTPRCSRCCRSPSIQL